MVAAGIQRVPSLSVKPTITPIPIGHMAPTDHPGVVMVGQPVVGNWGAMCPMGIGVK